MAVAFISQLRPETMTVVIDTDYANSPGTWAGYADDAVGLTPGSSQFDDFFGHYPILLDFDGERIGKLKKTDFSKYENGNTAPINNYDTMICFPRRAVRIKHVNEYIYISIAKTNRHRQGMDNLDSDNWWFSPWNSADASGNYCQDYIYVGAYEASYTTNSNNVSVLRSLPNVEPTSRYLTLSQARTYAHNRSSYHELLNFFVLTYLQAMYCIKYRAQNAQTVLGLGCTNAADGHNTGTTMTKGMDWGDKTDGTQSVKLFGIEDFYGNHQTMIDGMMTNSSGTLLVSRSNFNDLGTGYTATSNVYSSDIVDKTTLDIRGDKYTGFTPYPVSSINDNTKGFCDNAEIYKGQYFLHGGKNDYGSKAGVFSWNTKAFNVTGTGRCARLCYMLAGY